MRIALTEAYILHTRAFKDSSALVECFSKEHGIVSLVAKGIKRRLHLQGLIQPFIHLQVAWSGKSDLKTLTHIEAQIITPKLNAHKILLGLYLNELLIRLLQRHDPYPYLFEAYDKTLSSLSGVQKNHEEEFLLRQFELQLLAALGYGLNLTCDAITGARISPELLYSYDPSKGFFEALNEVSLAKQFTMSGASILALLSGQCSNEVELREAKKLMRFVLAHYLGNKPLESRKLFGLPKEVRER